MKLNKMLPDYKIEKAQKNIVFLLIRHSNFIKNSFCHSLTAHHTSEPSLLTETLTCTVCFCVVTNTIYRQPTYFKVQFGLVLESAPSLCYESMFQVISQNSLSPSQGDCNKAVNDFVAPPSFMYFDFKAQSKK